MPFWSSSCAATRTAPHCSPPTGPSKNGASCSEMCPPPPPFWIASSSRPKLFPSPVAVTACARHSPPPPPGNPRPPTPRRNQPTSRKRNDEFNALYLGLQRHPKNQKDPNRVSDQSEAA